MNRYKKIFALCILSWNFTVCIQAQCVEGDCINGFGKRWFTKHDTVLYVGQFVNKYPDGNGIATYRNGKSYEGAWWHGMWHGNGKLTLSDGQIISGQWENSRLKHAVELISAPNSNNALLATETRNSTFSTPTRDNNRVFEEPHYQTNVPGQTLRVDPPLSNTNVKFPQVWALAVGVAEYQNSEVQTLRYPDNDAFQMFAFWMSQQGGGLDDEHARVLVDDAATKKVVLNNMDELFSKAEADDLVIFFFSGHGLAGSFLTTDYDGAGLQLRHREINTMMTKCPARHKLIIADACFAGSFVASKGLNSRPNANEMSERFYGELQKSETGTAYFLSCAPNEESLEVNTFHDSVFTHFVLKGLKGAANTNGDKIITLKELFDYVYKNVTVYASSLGKSQTPMMKGNYDLNMPVAVLK